MANLRIIGTLDYVPNHNSGKNTRILIYIVQAKHGVQVFFGIFFGYFLFYVRGCCKNCKSHKDETNAEAAIGLFWVFFWFCRHGLCGVRVLELEAFRVVWFCRFTPLRT